MTEAHKDARALTLELLAARALDATICPSEVARAIAAGSDPDAPASDWRDAMPQVHAAIDAMVSEGLVRLSWKGKPLARRSGPYRIARDDTAS